MRDSTEIGFIWPLPPLEAGGSSRDRSSIRFQVRSTGTRDFVSQPHTRTRTLSHILLPEDESTRITLHNNKGEIGARFLLILTSFSKFPPIRFFFSGVFWHPVSRHSCEVPFWFNTGQVRPSFKEFYFRKFKLCAFFPAHFRENSTLIFETT